MKVVLIVGLVVVIAAAAALAAPRQLNRALLMEIGMVFGVGLVLFLFQIPPVGLLLLIAGGLLVGREIGTGTQSGLNGALLMSPVVILVLVLHLGLRTGRCRRLVSRSVKPLYAFMATVIVALIAGQYPWFPSPPASISAQLAQTAVFLFSCGLFLVAAHELQDQWWLRTITYLFIAMGSVHLLLRLVPGASAALQDVLPQAVTMGSMFWTWLVALSFGQALLNRALGIPGRLLMAAVTCAAIGIGLTQLGSWVSGWFPAVLSIGVVLLMRYPRPMLMATPAVGVLVLLGASLLTDLASEGDNVYSYETRKAALDSMVPLLTANPVLGLGPANYYHYSSMFPILGWYVKFNSHNNYLDLVAQTGLVGLGCFLWFYLSVGLIGWRLRSRPMGEFDRAFVYSVVAGLVASMAAAALGDWVIPFLYNTGLPGYRTSVLPWIFMGGMIAIEQRLARNS